MREDNQGFVSAVLMFEVLFLSKERRCLICLQKNTLQVPFPRFDYVSTQWPMKIHLFLWLLAGVNIKQAYMVNPHYLVS